MVRASLGPRNRTDINVLWTLARARKALKSRVDGLGALLLFMGWRSG